jgi:hypothetical protein
MDDIRTVIVTGIGALFSLLAPIQYFMYAMVLLFFLNFVFGLASDIVNGGKWSTKKALMFFVCCAVFFVTSCSAFIIGHFMGEHEQAVTVVKFLCYIAIFVFGTNMFRNMRDICLKGSQWYRFFDLCYYILGVQFIEKIPMIKKWQEQREKRNHNTVLDKDDN